MELGESVSWESPGRANKWSVSVVDVAQNNSHVCGCFGTHCLATVTAISHGRNLKPNPIRSGHYWEMSWRWSDGERGERETKGGTWQREREKRGGSGKRQSVNEEEETRDRCRRQKRMRGEWEAWMTSLCQPQCQLGYTHRHAESNVSLSLW